LRNARHCSFVGSVRDVQKSSACLFVLNNYFGLSEGILIPSFVEINPHTTHLTETTFDLEISIKGGSFDPNKNVRKLFTMKD
jgi:hypothetical protein